MVAGKSGTILILEGDPRIARIHRRRLERAGYEVVTANTAAGGMRRIREDGVELIVLDHLLPGVNGLEFYNRLKRAGLDVPVILVAGSGEEATVLEALRAGVRDVVTQSAEYVAYLPEAVDRVLRQVRTEQKLAESEAHLAAVINSAMDAIITVDADRCVTLFNPAAEHVFRCASSAAVGRPIDSFIPEIADGPKELFCRSAENATLHARCLELRGVRADGEPFPLEVSVSSAELALQKFCVVIARDITERRRAEERVREQAALIDRTTNAVLVSDLGGCIRFWNRGAERLYGWQAVEAIYRNADQLLFKEGSAALAEAHRTVSEKGDWSGELRQVTKAGKEVIVESQWTLLRDDKGQPRSRLCINTDITEKKRLESEFLRIQRMESIGTLASGIAHDLNNVLTPILMGVQLLAPLLPEEARESLLAPVQSSVERGAEMIRQMLSFARGNGSQRVELQLHHLIHDCRKLLDVTLPKAIELRADLPRDLWVVSGDATQVSQVLMNLCLNARDAMPKGGELTISCRNVVLDGDCSRLHPEAMPGPYVLLQVTDTGTGIPADILGKVYDPFFTTKEKGKGTGLGLSTSLAVVRSHGGFIRIDSDVGRGTEVSVYLPAVKGLQSHQVDGATVPVPVGSGETILVVDDEASIRAISKAMLEAHGYQVLTAGDGAEGVALYAQHRGEIHAVLTDMQMPVMDGEGTVRALQRLDPDVRIIIITGMSGGGGSDDGASFGVQGFLPKPYSAQRLLSTLREVLDRRALPGHEGPMKDLTNGGLKKTSASGGRAPGPARYTEADQAGP